MKIIRAFLQNQLTSGEVKRLQKEGVFFYDKDKKVTLVSLNFFDKLNLFFQRLFCCRSKNLKVKNFTKISNSQLKNIVQHENKDEQPIQVKNEPKNELRIIHKKEVSRDTLEQINKYIFLGRYGYGDAFTLLETLDPESEAVKEYYFKLSKKCSALFGTIGGKAFNKIQDIELQDEVINELAKTNQHYSKVQFIKNVESKDIIKRVIEATEKVGKEYVHNLLIEIARDEKWLGKERAQQLSIEMERDWTVESALAILLA